LQDQIQELTIIREANNKEMIGLETGIENQRKRADKAESERDQLINAIDDLTQNATGLEQNCEKLHEEVRSKSAWGHDLLEKYEKSVQDKTYYKNTIKSLEQEISRIKHEFIEKSDKLRARHEKRVLELENSIKVLNKTVGKYESQMQKDKGLKDKLDFALYQLELVNTQKFDSVYDR
jgi:predicted  nucleic acid-binding Zn-ribbon protein